MRKILIAFCAITFVASIFCLINYCMPTTTQNVTQEININYALLTTVDLTSESLNFFDQEKDDEMGHIGIVSSEGAYKELLQYIPELATMDIDLNNEIIMVAFNKPIDNLKCIHSTMWGFTLYPFVVNSEENRTWVYKVSIPKRSLKPDIVRLFPYNQ